MKRRIIWWVVSGLMVLSLVLASCAPKVAEEKKEVVAEKKEVVAEKKEVMAEKKDVVTEKGVEMVVDALGRSVPKPQYGGVWNLANPADPDFIFTRSTVMSFPQSSGWMFLTNEGLLQTDVLKGPAGSGKFPGLYHPVAYPEMYTGKLAESWEVIQPDTLKFKIRKGIHWQDKAPVYGAELTAEDVVYSFIMRYIRPGSITITNNPDISNMANPEKSIYIDPADPWTVVFKARPGALGILWEFVMREYIEPKALGPMEGEGWGTWRGVVGTGPFLLTDYVRGSSLTWQRNPNYWQQDELLPQEKNQLPYLDGVKVFIIPDRSTQYAAMRTGKIDMLEDIEAEDAESLIRTNPELKAVEKFSGFKHLAMRNDRAPFSDVRVRQAMNMAIDHDEIIRDYYGGKAAKYYYPVLPIAEHKDAWIPLEEMPEVVQQIWGYYPDKAKKLLAEAGYPNGFTTSVLVSSAEEEDIDLASLVAAYWAKVGVTLKIDVREPAVYASMRRLFTYQDGTIGSFRDSEMYRYPMYSAESRTNYARQKEPLVEKMKNLVGAAYFDWDGIHRITRENLPELQKLAIGIWLPAPISYHLLQPWVMRYYGQTFEDRKSSTLSQLPAGRYIWIDQELKKSLRR